MTKQKNNMPMVWQAIIIYVSSFILGIITSWPFGKLYRWIEGPYHGGGVGVIFGEDLSNFLGGSIWSYFFFLGLLVAIFIKRKSCLVWFIGILYFLVTVILYDGWQYFLYSLVFSLLGFLLGKLILWIKTKAGKK